MKVGHKVRRIRELKEIAMKDMADRLNMSPAGYSKIERDEVSINIDKLTQIAQELKMTPEEILSFDEKIVFNQSTLHSSFNYGPVTNVMSDKVIQLYEDKITLLEDKVKYLNEIVENYKMKNPKAKTMEELTKNFEEFVSGKETNDDNKKKLEDILKEIVKPSLKDNQK